MISFHFMPQQQQYPAGGKKRTAPDPLREEEQHEPRKNQWYANSVQKFIPPGSVLVIVLRHVVRQIGHSAPPFAGKPIAEL
jgi:hypothetical protein